MRRLPPAGDDSGYVAILVAVCLPLFVGLCALAFDVASWRVTASRVQSAADAAALGGTIYLPNDRITAFETAEELVAKNGFTGDDVVVTPQIVDGRRQLRVTVSVTVDNTFGGLFGHGQTTITRTAVAEFAGPVPMGSPCNVLGNENMEGLRVGSAACSGQQGTYWLNIAGTDTNKVNGDAYASGYCTRPFATVIDGCSSIAPAGGIWGSPPNNTDHTGGAGSGAFTGYLFGVRVQAPVGELDIQGFDLPWVAVGDSCNGDALDGAGALVDPNPYVDDAAVRYAGGEGPFCTGDSQMGEPQGEPDSPVRTVVRLYAPSPSPSNPLAGQLLCSTELPGWGNDTALVNALDATKPAYDETLARTFRQWASICPAPIASPEVGTYVVQVLTVGGGGQNRFALRATAGSSSANDALGLFALGRVSFFNAVPAGTSDFYLARLGSDSAGRSLTLGFYDLADATAPVQVTLLQPDSDVPFANCVSAPQPGATGTGPLNGCTITTTPATNGGRWQLVRIQVPSTYRCAADANVSACWSRVRLSTAAGQNDTTTWRASLDGDPVRLVE